MRLDDLVDRLEPEIVPVRLPSDRQAAADAEQARRRIEVATSLLERVEAAEQGSMSKPETAKARAALAEASETLTAAETAADAKTVTLHLCQLGNARWKRLLWLVPPTDDQRRRLGKGLDHNPELFPVAALAFSLVDVDEHGKLIGPAIDQGELDTLDTALERAAGDPKRAAAAIDENLPASLRRLNDGMKAGGWDTLVAKLYELNLEVSQVPLYSSASRPNPTS